MTNRIALVIQYNGSGFSGWQNQSNLITVQGTLEEKIAELDPNRPVKVIAAGRTDSGVHASGQVVHFDSSGPIPINKWPSALNGRLPATVRVLEAASVSKDWHACYSAKNRRYRYSIFNGCHPNLFLQNISWHKYKVRLDVDLMKNALNDLVGFHDFAAFQKAGSNRSNSLTTVQEVSICRDGDIVTVEIQASGFLYGMVRLLMGQLVALGENRLTLREFKNRWRNGLRSEVREAAPPHGLCLIRVGYEEKIFSKEKSFDTFPRFSLPIVDSFQELKNTKD
ncbi:tRNA pseudouridine(38-40) synthase TruA [Prochlorococcus marinus]|uniref:tRNA pseudouridine synthase A n=1 Tax=Prochlorococcus marinus XMU1408 TaxID=2213228 RepID=A0A318R074_PROMR|nr:tRNA pseudouridine(38-40) synthase TruA [Prochlorococcus marinus]MBW3042753.1 tRNA pseudouridine(38-40) synthase TruA [Prochlorococcus marinus str. XMU1408]PYE00583.1 tRNA pseudouridine(38-40) synthase TruA [Prochlorococcus marinus XMU1408]